MVAVVVAIIEVVIGRGCTSTTPDLPVDDARIPSLSSLAPSENPSVSVGMMNALIPRCFLSLERVYRHARVRPVTK